MNTATIEFSAKSESIPNLQDILTAIADFLPECTSFQSSYKAIRKPYEKQKTTYVLNINATGHTGTMSEMLEKLNEFQDDEPEDNQPPASSTGEPDASYSDGFN